MLTRWKMSVSPVMEKRLSRDEKTTREVRRGKRSRTSARTLSARERALSWGAMPSTSSLMATMVSSSSARERLVSSRSESVSMWGTFARLSPLPVKKMQSETVSWRRFETGRGGVARRGRDCDRPAEDLERLDVWKRRRVGVSAAPPPPPQPSGIMARTYFD